MANKSIVFMILLAGVIAAFLAVVAYLMGVEGSLTSYGIAVASVLIAMALTSKKMRTGGSIESGG